MTKKAPILLIPGVIAPNQLKSWKYFNSHKVDEENYYVCTMDHWGTLEKRSQAISNFIKEQFKDEKFHVISHSKGGLDLYYLLEKQPNLQNQILSHTCISCPLKGSYIATIFNVILIPLTLFPRIKEIQQTLKEISSFNIDFEQYTFKKYYIAANIKNIFLTYPLFMITYLILYIIEGKNDGFVSIKSAEHGQNLLLDQSDHISLIGHFFGKKRIKIFEDILIKIESTIYGK